MPQARLAGPLPPSASSASALADTAPQPREVLLPSDPVGGLTDAVPRLHRLHLVVAVRIEGHEGELAGGPAKHVPLASDSIVSRFFGISQVSRTWVSSRV